MSKACKHRGSFRSAIQRSICGIESLEGRVLMAAAPPILMPPAGLTFLNPATVPQFTNDITAINPFVSGFHYQADNTAGNHFTVGAYPIVQDLGLGTNPATGQPYQTPLFGYGPDAASATYPGRTFEVQKNSPIAVTWVNGLPTQHLVNIDPTLLDFGMPGMEITYNPVSNEIPEGIPIVTHLHGGHTDAIYDGTPMQWWTPADEMGMFRMGMDYIDTQAANPTQPPNTFVYRNDQETGTLWYHDHAMGVTRLNAYAGMAGFYIIRDNYDTGLAGNPLGLPAGDYEMGLAIQDKQFLSDGQMWFPAEAQTWNGTPNVASTLPEMFGDVVLVNGKAWPKMNVEARRYRLRLLNASDSRFYTMSVAPTSSSNKNTVNTSSKGLPIWQIGTDDGLLNSALPLQQLTLAPGERADVIIDFTGYAPGTRFIVTNSAKAPFPGGGVPASGTLDRIMAFDVIAPTGLDTTTPPAQLTNLRPTNPIPAPPAVPPAATRSLALYETLDAYGRITPLMGIPASSKLFMDPITENITQNTTEIWEIYNNTADTHPIHLHQVAFQILSRQNFSTKLVALPPVNGVQMWGMTTIKLKNTPTVATGNEVAWKDTIQLNPGEVIKVRAFFDLPGKYVTHCHILSHEEHDMMRYMQVGAEAFPLPGFVIDADGQVVPPTDGTMPMPMVAATFSAQKIDSMFDESLMPIDQLLA